MSYLTTPQPPPPQPAPAPPAQRRKKELQNTTAQDHVTSLKRKASDISDKSPTQTAGAFIQWRLASIDAYLEVIKRMIVDYRENAEADESRLKVAMKALQQEQAELERELVVVQKQRQFIKEDLQDSKQALETAYVEEIYHSWRAASEEGQRQLKKRALDRNKFRKICQDYLAAGQGEGPIEEESTFCHVLGWQAWSLVKCAHIVPFCFNSTELSYMFGADDAALHSCRNGLFLNRVIEKGWDNGWVAIVPDETVDRTPTEWKIILLNESVRNDMVHKNKEGKITRYGDFDGQRLKFLNDNRPARRYLYFRYVMAYLHAAKSKYPNFREKVPSGTMWASPGKPDGYLRKSVLRALAQRVGDTALPQDLLAAGTFVDTEPESGRPIEDQKAVIELSARIREKEDGALQDETDDDEDEDEE